MFSLTLLKYLLKMKSEFTAIIEAAPEGDYWAMSPEIQGANGQGETILEARQSLRDAIMLIFEDVPGHYVD
jgi:predicted RNase H-like HicB family nuclease